MIDRVIENWLTNTNERNYQVPFCQALASQGYEIIYVSKHRPLEKGKDIFAIDKDGNYHAYQLKTGNFTQADYRKYNGEILELVQLAFNHPLIDKSKMWESYIVANGIFDDHARELIDEFNRNNITLKRNFSKLNIIDRNQMLQIFSEAQGEFFPLSTIDNKEFIQFQNFLRLYLLDGKDFFPKEDFFNYIRLSIFSDLTSKSDFLHGISSSVLVTSYILRSFQECQNHFAIFEGWVILLSFIINFCKKNDFNNKIVDSTYNLIFNEIIITLENLKKEALSKQNFLEGDMLGDGGELYRIRLTLVFGALAAFELHLVDTVENHRLDNDLIETIKKNMPIFFWGESAFPYFFNIIKLLEKSNHSELATMLLHEITASIINKNHPDSDEGIANPYISHMEILNAFWSVFDEIEDNLDFKNFTGGSYILLSLIYLNARRGERDFLERYWLDITNIQLQEFQYDFPEDLFLFRVKEGTNYSIFPKYPQSWATLIEEAQEQNTIPDIWKTYSHLLRFVTLVYPFRMNDKVIKLLDS